MKIGVCVSPQQLADCAGLSCDYLELPVNALAAMNDIEWKEFKQTIQRTGIPTEAFNILFPGTLKVVGPAVDESAIKQYLAHALHRVAEIGGKVVVFGSGGARSIPEGWSTENAWEQLAQAALWSAEQAALLYLLIVMEPLSRKDCNLLNTVEEGVVLVQQVNHPRLKLLADLYHMQTNAEPLDTLKPAAPYLHHIHVAQGLARTVPLPEGGNDVPEFVRILQDCGYTGRISIEASSDHYLEDFRQSIPYLRNLTKQSLRDSIMGAAAQPNNPLHGITLEMILHWLVDNYGWEAMGKAVNIKCFNSDPSIKSSLKFLRMNLWARQKVEDLYLNLKAKADRK